MDIILIAGLWLRQSIWSEVSDALMGLGHRPISVALPGIDDSSANATLDDHVAAVVAAIDGSEQPLVVGHSAAATLAWMAADQRPSQTRNVALIGGFPAGDGDAYADFFETVDGVMPFPGWDPFEGPDTADLDDATKSQIATDAVAVPGGVAKGTVRLLDDRRFDVPIVLVCPEFTPDQARSWIANGDVPELERAKHVSFVDIDSGHWPMVTQPTELARILVDGHAS